jgi:hypothetical protein
MILHARPRPADSSNQLTLRQRLPQWNRRKALGTGGLSHRVPDRRMMIEPPIASMRSREARRHSRCRHVVQFLIGLGCALAAMPVSALAKVELFPPSFHVEEIKTDGATIHVPVGGTGPAIVMLHGFGDTGDMWQPLASSLVGSHTIVVPDLRGMGLSSHPASGYDKKTEARDIARVLDRLKIDKADLVTHDIGNMVGYAFAAQYPERVTVSSPWTRRSPALGRGTRSFATRFYGISTSGDRMSSGW